MEGVIRAAVVYVFLMVLFNITPKRAIASLDTFDFVLLLIISEATQNALVGKDFSVTQSFIVIATLTAITLLMGWLKCRYNWIEKILSGTPLVLMVNGETIRDRMKKNQVDDEDILSAAREMHGLERKDQIKYAILETSGTITIVPKER
jgi:uncharacterized membrane protein YcaP (DUF421 family)